MQMDAGLDTGAMLLEEAVPLGPRDTAATLHDRLAALGAGLIVRVLAEAPVARPQPEVGASYAPKLSRADGALDWRHPAEQLDRQIRAFRPWPGSFCRLGDAVLKVLEAKPVSGGEGQEPGTVMEDLTVACGSGLLRLLRVQRAGRAPMDTAVFLRGHPVTPGTRLG